jgi:hypothetical protein
VIRGQIPEQSSQAKDQRNPYQAKINYFMNQNIRNSSINSTIAARKEAKKKLKTFVKNSNTGNVNKKFRPTKDARELVSGGETPSSRNRSSQDPHHLMAISQSMKSQINLKSELCTNDSTVQSLEKQLLKLTEKVKKLEKENRKLKDENKRLKKSQVLEKDENQPPPGSHYNPNCKKSHQRESSRSSMNYNSSNFNYTNQFSDFTRSYSFENSHASKAMRSSEPEPNLLAKYNNYIERPTSLHEGKENIKCNIEIDSLRPKIRGNESILMQKVSRILEKRDINKKESQFTPRIYDDINPRPECKSLKHSKNEIIARINNKYGQRMD